MASLFGAAGGAFPQIAKFPWNKNTWPIRVNSNQEWPYQLPFAEDYVLISPVGFKGNLELLEILFFSRGLEQMAVSESPDYGLCPFQVAKYGEVLTVRSGSWPRSEPQASPFLKPVRPETQWCRVVPSFSVSERFPFPLDNELPKNESLGSGYNWGYSPFSNHQPD